jgi:hypothetical protein
MVTELAGFTFVNQSTGADQALPACRSPRSIRAA